jgi:UDP-N-acetylmuramate--alanine ligase
MPQTVLDNALDGDVVLCMGAGSIGQVPASIIALLAAQPALAPGVAA